MTAEEKGKIIIDTDRHPEFNRLDDNIDIRCSCGQTTLELRYGDYEILARCPNCGAEESVYSG